MKETGMLFKAPMVRALLDGSKTQTRRPVKPHRSDDAFCLVDYGDGWWPYRSEDGESPNVDNVEYPLACPYGKPGDRIWVRETWRSTGCGGRSDYMAPRDMQPHQVWYDADGAAPEGECTGKTRTSIHMPRWASRILLEIVSVSVERLQDISDADILAEGIDTEALEESQERYDVIAKDGNCSGRATERTYWRDLWESTGGDWDANPWLWVIEFKRVTP